MIPQYFLQEVDTWLKMHITMDETPKGNHVGTIQEGSTSISSCHTDSEGTREDVRKSQDASLNATHVG